MPSYSKNDVVLVHYPFTDLTSTKVRPAIVVHAPHASHDLIIVPLTSQVVGLKSGEFVLNDWALAGLNTTSAVKRGIFTIHPSLIVKQLAHLTPNDAQQVESSLRAWLGL